MEKTAKRDRLGKAPAAVLTGLAFVSAGLYPAVAQQAWSSMDEWRAQYSVGDQVRLSISGNQSDFQTCTVTENDSNAVMRVRCGAFKYWSAGEYVASRNFVRPMPAASSPTSQAGAGQAAGSALATRGGAAAAGWTASDGWRSRYKVGERINMSISGKPEDVQVCAVTENDPTSVMRVNCNRFKEWVAGEYMVSEFQVRATTKASTTPAQTGPQTSKGNSTSLKVGEYACTGSGGRMMIGLGFKVTSGNRYTDLSGGRSGTFTIAGGNITFNGGHLNGVSGRNLSDNWFTVASQARCGPYR